MLSSNANRKIWTTPIPLLGHNSVLYIHSNLLWNENFIQCMILKIKFRKYNTCAMIHTNEIYVSEFRQCNMNRTEQNRTKVYSTKLTWTRWFIVITYTQVYACKLWKAEIKLILLISNPYPTGTESGWLTNFILVSLI